MKTKPGQVFVCQSPELPPAGQAGCLPGTLSTQLRGHIAHTHSSLFRTPIGEFALPGTVPTSGTASGDGGEEGMGG